MMDLPTSIEPTAAELADHFGEGSGMPTAAQWRAVLAEPASSPICILNLVKLRAEADYGPGSAEPARSGLEAFGLYAAGSVPRIMAAGGSVVFHGAVESVLVGDDAEWDTAVVVTWPNRAALLSLFQDPAYRAAFPHRRAAVDRYRATVVAGG